MIEGVNSAIANAQLSRGNAGRQQDFVESLLPTETVAAPAEFAQAPFVSPYISVDYNLGKAVLQIRDSDTGDVLSQFPSESTLEARRRAEAIRESQQFLVSLRESQESSATQQTSSQGFEESQGQVNVSQLRSAPIETQSQSAPQTSGSAQVAVAALVAGAQAANTSQSSSGTVSTAA